MSDNYRGRLSDFFFNKESSQEIGVKYEYEYQDLPQEVWVGYDSNGNTPEESYEFTHVMVWLGEWDDEVIVGHMPLTDGLKFRGEFQADRSSIRKSNGDLYKKPKEWFPESFTFTLCMGIWSVVPGKGNYPTADFILAMNEHSVGEWSDNDRVQHMKPHQIKNNISYSDQKKRFMDDYGEIYAPEVQGSGGGLQKLASMKKKLVKK